MTGEKLTELQKKINYGKSLERKIYAITETLNALDINKTADKKAEILNFGICELVKGNFNPECAYAVFSEVGDVLKDIGIGSIETEVIEKIVHLLEAKLEVLKTEFEGYAI